MTSIRYPSSYVDAVASGRAGPPWEPFPWQIPPEGDWWDTWVLKTGRGGGKTRALVEYIRNHIKELGPRARVGFGAPTNADARDICAEGESGLISTYRDEFRHNRSLNEAYHRETNAYVKFMGTENPDRWNGPQWTLLAFDELSLCNPKAIAEAQFGLRLGSHPRMIAAYTPRKRQHIKDLEAEEGKTLFISRATTFDNTKLPKRRLEQLQRQYGGTQLGRQMLEGLDTDEVEGAYWKQEWIDDNRVSPEDVPTIIRMVEAVDPAGTHNLRSDLTGLSVAGIGDDGDYYVFHISGVRLSPDGWANRASFLYDDLKCDVLVGEVNHGGDMVVATIEAANPNVNVKPIHASRGKAVRAEPVARLYEQGRVHHVGIFPDGEEQMCEFPVANENDDQVDALVYSITELMEGGGAGFRYLE